MNSESYKDQFNQRVSEYTMGELIDRYAAGLPMSRQDRIDVERLLKSRASKLEEK